MDGGARRPHCWACVEDYQLEATDNMRRLREGRQYSVKRALLAVESFTTAVLG